MITFKTKCAECGEDVTASILDARGEAESTIDVEMVIEGLVFRCECGTDTILEVTKYQD